MDRPEFIREGKVFAFPYSVYEALIAEPIDFDSVTEAQCFSYAFGVRLNLSGRPQKQTWVLPIPEDYYFHLETVRAFWPNVRFAGALFLEELEHAKRRGANILAEIIGIGLTGDAYHMTSPAPNGEGAVRAMNMAIREAGIDPSAVDYINAHGTSTPLNDASETAAIKEVFRESAYNVKISSTKSMVGHLLGAAAAIELIVCALAIRDGKIPPTINQENRDPDCDLDYVPNSAQDLKVDVALSNAFGFGGHNCTIIVKRYSDKQ